MLNVYITKKLSDDLRLSASNIIPAESNPKYCWLGHLFYLNRRKYIVFLNQQSCFAVIIDKKESKNVWEDFKARVHLWLENHRVERSNADEYLSHFEQINILKAHDKRFLGTMNDVVNQSKYIIDEMVGQICLKMDFAEIKINETPHSRGKGCVFPHDGFREMFGLQPHRPPPLYQPADDCDLPL